MGVLDTWFKMTFPRTNTDKKMPEALVTHFCMKGGKFNVPFILADEFLENYIQAICTGERLFLIERRTKVFCMYFDFDVVQIGPMSDVELSRILAILGGLFREFFPYVPDEEFAAYVFKASKSETKEAIEESKLLVADSQGTKHTCFKTGFHIIYPKILVNQRHALTIRNIFIAELKKELGERAAPKNTWEDLVDECVFLANGLRMVYSNKTAKCTSCNGKSKGNSGISCTTCINGRIDVGRPYVPHAVFSALGVLDKEELHRIRVDPEYCIKQASIRRDDPSAVVTQFTLPEGYVYAPDPNSRTHKRLLTERKKGVRDVRYDGSQYDQDVALSGGWKRSMIQMESDDPLYDRLKDFVNRSSVYAKTAIHSIYMNKRRTSVFIKATGHNSTFCMNKGDCHNSNSIYFQIVKKLGCSQRCFKRECKDWKSNPIPLPVDLERDIFSPQTVQAAVDEERENMKNREILFPMTSKTANQKKLKYLRLQGIQNECNLSEMKKTMEIGEKSRVQYNCHPSLPDVTKDQLYTWGMKEYMDANTARIASKGDKLTEMQMLKSANTQISKVGLQKKKSGEGNRKRKRKGTAHNGTIATF